MQIKNIFEKVLNLIFPEKCIVCKKEDNLFCKKCFLEIPKSYKLEKEIYSIYEYKNLYIKDLIKNLKYNGNVLPAKRFGEILAEFIMNNFSKHEQIYINPIPLREKDSRLNNHAEKIAEETIYFLKSEFNYKNTEMINILKKTNIQRQASLNKIQERKNNIKNKILPTENKFFIKENSLLIILDDVYTTGSTLLEAKKVFEINKDKYKFAKIICLSVAH